MKTYKETTIRRAEIAQLILLYQLYRQSGSHDLIFQGGTAIRWCYAGTRFSEDLDFVTPLAPDAAKAILTGAVKGAEKVMIPHFGVGSLTVSEKSSRGSSLKCFVDFRPDASREKISVKIEIEGLAEQKAPESERHVLSTLPTVSYMIAVGEFRVPRPHSVIVTETPAEILSDKVRALLERRYLKGRDLYDLWYLRSVLNVPPDVKIIERKFGLYKAPFTVQRDVDFFTVLSAKNKKELQTAIDRDLSRFLPPEVLTVHRRDGYTVFLEAVRSLFSELKTKGVRLP